MSETIELIFGAVLVFTLVVLSTIALVYYKERYACFNYPSPWCYKDWECKDVPTGSPGRFPALQAQQSAVACTPETDGSSPEVCTNVWGVPVT